jgi:hypothetical protein
VGRDVEMRSYLDRSIDDLPPFVIRGRGMKGAGANAHRAGERHDEDESSPLHLPGFQGGSDESSARHATARPVTALCGSWQKPDADGPSAGTLEATPAKKGPGRGPRPAAAGLPRRPSGAREQPAIRDREEVTLERHLQLDPLIHPSHQTAAIEAFGVEPAECRDLTDRPRPRRLLVFEEIVPHDALAELARQGISFDGSHGDGADYPGRLFAAHGGELAAVDQPFGVLSVPIALDTLRVDDEALAGLAAYKRLKARVEKDLRREPPATLTSLPPLSALWNPW